MQARFIYLRSGNQTADWELMSRSPPSDKRPGWHWSDYWRSGRVEVMTVETSSGEAAFDPAPLWRAYFGSFENGARLLDLATGGGQVARIAAGVAEAQGKVFEVTGVDYADLGPAAGPTADGVTLLGGVALEKLPFPAARFDGATSQFGIEYADARGALGELSRVLKPGGSALILAHHSGSAISRRTADQVAAFDRVVGEGAAMRLARRAFVAHQKRVSPEARQAAEAAFREAVQRAAAKLAPGPEFDQARALVEYLDDLARSIARYEPASALARLQEVEAGNAAWRQRQRSQMAAALDEKGAGAFLDRARRAGLSVAAQSVERDARDAIIAWRLELRKV